MIGFFTSLFGLGLYSVASVRKDINNFNRERRFRNYALENNLPWYTEKKKKKRDIKTNRVLWIVTKNNIDYLCYYPTEEIFLNLTQWNIDKDNFKRRMKANELNQLGYRKIMTEEIKKNIFGNYGYNYKYCNTRMELNENGDETGNFYQVGIYTKESYFGAPEFYHMRYFNIEEKEFGTWLDITEEEFKRRNV